MASPLLASRAVFRDAVRRYLRDRAPFNTLLSDKETDEDELDLCIELALSDFNETAPVICSYSVTNFPAFDLLLRGVVIQVLQSAGILQSRNDLKYSAGGVSVNISDKAQQYLGWLKGFIQAYEVKKRNLKFQLNMSQCWGGIGSEYGLLSGLY